MSDLPIHVLGQTSNVRKVEDDSVKATFPHFFSSLVQLDRIYCIQHSSLFFLFKLLYASCCLWVLFQYRGPRVVASSDKMATAVFRK